MIQLKHWTLLGALALSSNAANAVVAFTWDFTNASQVWGNDEAIVLQARLTNTGDEALPLGDFDYGIDGAGMTWGTFPHNFHPGIGEYDLRYRHDQTLINLNADLKVGSSIDFIFAEFIPIGIVPNGIYQTVSAELYLGQGRGTPSIPIHALNNFSATVVPLPAAAWLFASGILGLIGLGRRKPARA